MQRCANCEQEVEQLRRTLCTPCYVWQLNKHESRPARVYAGDEGRRAWRNYRRWLEQQEVKTARTALEIAAFEAERSGYYQGPRFSAPTPIEVVLGAVVDVTEGRTPWWPDVEAALRELPFRFRGVVRRLRAGDVREARELVWELCERIAVSKGIAGPTTARTRAQALGNAPR